MSMIYSVESILSCLHYLLVNNAGTYIDPPFLKLTHDTFQKTIPQCACRLFYHLAFARNWIKAGTQGRVLLQVQLMVS